MPQGTALVWLPHEEVPRVARIKGYIEIPDLNRRADPNPYYRGKPPAGAAPLAGRWGNLAAASVLLLALSVMGWM